MTAATATVYPGYPTAAAGSVAVPRHTGHLRILVLLGAALLVLAGAVAGLSALITPTPKHVVCPPDCGRPPTGTPLAMMPRYTAGDGSFSVGYLPTALTHAQPTTTADSITQQALDGAVQLFGGAAGNAGAQQIATALVAKRFPGATRAYPLPNAMLGYQPGYGEVDDFYPQGANQSYQRLRVIVIASVKNGEALVAMAVGPYDEYSPGGDTDGHPSGADLKIALALDPIVNSFSWRGDPSR